MPLLSSTAFYSTYHGHKPADIRVVAAALRNGEAGRRSIIWLVGDSSLDNKYWLGGASEVAVNGMEKVLHPPRVILDVAAHVNAELVRRGLGDKWACVNAAVEESTLGARVRGTAVRLLPQDEMVRELIGPGDALVCCVGGNDIALRPTMRTIVAVLALTRLARDNAIKAGLAWGFGSLLLLFRDATELYIKALCERACPSIVVPCTIYFPAESAGSWADTALAMMRYHALDGRERVRAILRAINEFGTQRVAVPGARAVPLALYDVLDPSAESLDYIARVEPSVEGGRKLAVAIIGAIVSE